MHSRFIGVFVLLLHSSKLVFRFVSICCALVPFAWTTYTHTSWSCNWIFIFVCWKHWKLSAFSWRRSLLLHPTQLIFMSFSFTTFYRWFSIHWFRFCFFSLFIHMCTVHRCQNLYCVSLWLLDKTFWIANSWESVTLFLVNFTDARHRFKYNRTDWKGYQMKQWKIQRRKFQ